MGRLFVLLTAFGLRGYTGLSLAGDVERHG